VAALVVTVAVALGGCTSPRNALGTSTSRCYRALPVARDAVHDEGRFAGVRYLTIAALAHALASTRPSVVDVPVHDERSGAAVCVVAYFGRFSASSVERGWTVDARTGRLALVVVRARDERLVATVVLERAPLRFRRLFAVS